MNRLSYARWGPPVGSRHDACHTIAERGVDERIQVQAGRLGVGGVEPFDEVLGGDDCSASGCGLDARTLVHLVAQRGDPRRGGSLADHEHSGAFDQQRDLAQSGMPATLGA